MPNLCRDSRNSSHFLQDGMEEWRSGTLFKVREQLELGASHFSGIEP
ncbi:MAG TPA: hypothetical protein V6D11_02400 [Waterburya sp.]